jgi:hypothetical protein
MTQEPPEAAVVTPFPARKRYEAFKESGLPIPRLALRARDAILSVPYYPIGAILFDCSAGELSFRVDDRRDVTIRGRNLLPVFSAMHRQECSLVHEFDAGAFLAPDPRDLNAAFIECIEISGLRPDKPDSP